MPDIRHSIMIDAPSERIHPLISSGSGLRMWWAADVTEDRSTGLVELGFFKRATIYALEPMQSVKQGEVAWVCQSGKEWQGTKLIFKLVPADRSTQLRFAHNGWQAESDYFISCNTTWGELMFRLKAVA